MSEASWGVVTTTDEPTQLVVAFAAYHLAIGAAEVHVHLDAPDPEGFEILRAMDGVFVTTTDEAYWEQNGGNRPGYIMTRQMRNATRVYHETKVDWLLHIDADEFVRGPETIPEAMTLSPSPDISVRFGMLERVRLTDEPDRTIFDGAFRVPVRDYDDWGPDVYGRFSKFLKQGVSAHIVGKAMVQTGQDFDLGVHHGRNRGTRDRLENRHAGQQIYHFDGLTPLHFFLKLALRFNRPKVINGDPQPDGPHRAEQMRFTEKHIGMPFKMMRMVNKMQSVDDLQMVELARHGALVDERFTPAELIASRGIDVDLSVKGFDDALRIKYADVIEKYGIAVPD